MRKSLLFLLFTPLSLWAKGPNERAQIDSVQVIQEVVVSANKTAVIPSYIPLSISMVSQEEIESSSESALLPALSHHIPGLFVTQRGVAGFGVSSGAAGVVNIRGVGQSNKVLMLLDGHPQWAGVFGHALPDIYLTSNVERVEVIRGPGSLLYGSNAMGGVINVITRSQKEDGISTSLRAMAGSYGTQKYQINNGIKKGKFNSFISLNHDRTDGHRPQSAFQITNGLAKVSYHYTPHWMSTLQANIAYLETNNPGPISAPAIDNWMRIWRGSVSASVENQYNKYNGAILLFYNGGKHTINDGYQNGIPRDYLFRSTDRNTGILLYESFQLLPGNEFTIGLDYKNWGGNTLYDYANGSQREEINRSIHETAGYLVAQQRIGKIGWINAGIRYQYNSQYGSQWIPQAGVTSHLFEGNTLRASFSKGFRSPTLRELYISYPPYSMANPNLKPEEMFNYEIAIEQLLLQNRMQINLALFYIEGKNLIQVINKQLDNVGRFYNKGVEFETNYRICPAFSLSANYSYLHTNKAIAGAPTHKAFLEGRLQLADFSLTVNAQSIFGLKLIGSDFTKTENYTLLNARAAYCFYFRKSCLTLFVKGENLTNTTYTINEGYPMPGIVAFGGIDFRF